MGLGVCGVVTSHIASMLVEQCLWSPLPSQGLHHGQQTDEMASVLVQHPPDYALLDPAPLSAQEKVVPPISDLGTTHGGKDVLSPSNSPIDVGDITKGSPLHSILHETLSKKALVATVQLPVTKQNTPPEPSRTTNFGSSLFEVFDADSASEYSDDSTSCSGHSVTRLPSDAQSGSKNLASNQAPVSTRTPLCLLSLLL